jgi:hypothetical protein
VMGHFHIERNDKENGTEERYKNWCVVFLHNCPGYKVEMTKLFLVLVLCQKICV